MLTGVLIAAAGNSTRMGQHKALLPIGESNFLEHLINIYLYAKIPSIIVTLPSSLSHMHHHSAIICKNDWPELGLVGSIRTALKHLPHIDALIINPIDAPLTPTSLVQQMCTYLFQDTPSIVSPYYRETPGHPVMFSKHFFNEINSNQCDNGVHILFQKYARHVRKVVWDSPKILANINSPQDYLLLN